MSRRHRRSLRAWALGCSLTVALTSVAALGYQAVGLDRTHRSVAEDVLRDYSAFAADQFARLATERITTLSKTILEPIACGSSAEARRSAAADRGASSCANPIAVDGFFEVDTETGHVVFTTGSVAADVADAIGSLPMSKPFGFGLLTNGGEARVMGYWRDRIPDAAAGVVGFVAPAAILRPVFDDIVHDERLLPGSLAEPEQNAESLTIDVLDGRGRSIYRSGVGAAAFAADQPLGLPQGNMQVRLGIKEAAAEHLIIGGMPRSRLPLLLSLLTVAVGLLAIGTWQVQRERRIAQMQVDFVRSASHELRTPLAQIRLFSETLQLGRVRSWSEVRQSLSFVDQQSHRLSRLVDNLLTFAHSGQRREARLAPVDLVAFVEDTSRQFQPIVEALGQQVRFEHDEPCVVHADREWLTQVVLNVLDNAAKYGPAGQTICVRVERDDQQARLVIADQGPGIPSRDRRRVFESFVRLSREHERRTGGTGIGLAVAAELMAAMNGSIWADTVPLGARLIVALPVRQAAKATQPIAVGDDARAQVA